MEVEMCMNVLISILIIVHIIGAIITMVIHYKDGSFKWASKYGDGIRNAKPCDIVVMDCFAWEVEFLILLISTIENLINNLFDEKRK